MNSISEIKESLVTELGVTQKGKIRAIELALRAAFRLPSRKPCDPVRIRLILVSVSVHFGIGSVEELISSTRATDAVKARAAAYHFLKMEGTMSASEIMKALNRDRSLSRNIESNLKEFMLDEDFKNRLKKINNETRI